MNPYVVRFALANIVLTIITGVAAVALELKSGMSLGIAVAVVSSIFAAEAFAKDHARAPSAEEKRIFACRLVDLPGSCCPRGGHLRAGGWNKGSCAPVSVWNDLGFWRRHIGGGLSRLLLTRQIYRAFMI